MDHPLSLKSPEWLQLKLDLVLELNGLNFQTALNGAISLMSLPERQHPHQDKDNQLVNIFH
jgi:hypothetical protein